MMKILFILFYYVIQWYFVLLLAFKTTNESIVKIHDRLSHLQTLLCIYFIVYKNDIDKAYTIALSYYVYDIIQMIILRYRRNIFQHVVFTFHHICTIYLILFDNYVFRTILYKVELSNIALVMEYFTNDVIYYKSYFQLIQCCWYSYFRIGSILPPFPEILLLENYELYCFYVFYMIGVYWATILMYRFVVD